MKGRKLPDRLQADVIIPIHTNPLMTSNCVESVLANSGSALRSLILVNDGAREREMPEVLARFEQHEILGYGSSPAKRIWDSWEPVTSASATGKGMRSSSTTTRS